MTPRERMHTMNPMNWALQQGLLGAGRQQTLAPSLTGMGETRYLTREDFLKMIAAALVLHVAVIGIAGLFRDDSVTDIPVRALSFKIGDADRVTISAPPRVAAPAPLAASKPVSAPAARPAPSSVWQKNTAPPRIAPLPLKPEKIESIAPMPPIAPTSERQRPPDNPPPLAPLPATAPAIAPNPTPAAAPPLAALPDPNLLSQPAVAPNPQRFVREATTAPAAANAADETAQSVQAARARYEQEISGWIERHKLYPADAHGAEGRAVVRVRIDRAGNVRYYGIEESAGNTVLDTAAIDMIRRANPMPAVPNDYPAGSLVEFLIPISFKVPR